MRNGSAVIGTLGLVFEAIQRDILTKAEAKRCEQEAVGEHGLRISVALYQRQRVLEELERRLAPWEGMEQRPVGAAES